MSLNVVIMSGGAGTRLWPMSRAEMPKQLQSLIGDKTLIQQTLERVLPLTDIGHIYIATVAKYITAMKTQLPQLNDANFILEPKLKNNAAAIGLNAVHLYHKDHHAVMVSLHSDHAVTKVDNFHKAIRHAAEVIKQYPNYLVIVGIRPQYPSTELGYIQTGEVLTSIASENVYNVKRFVEKPEKTIAEQFLADGHYLWNAGYFMWQVDTLLELYKQFLPRTYEHLMIIEAAIGTDSYQAVLEEHYDQMDEISIDYAILEQAPKIAVLPADIGWSDIGTWQSLHEIIASVTGEHVVKNGHHVQHDTEDSLIYSVGDKLVATIGLKNVVIVDTPDVLLVADKSKSHQIKKIIDQLKAENKHQYL